MPSLSGFLRSLKLSRRLDQEPTVVVTSVPETDVTVSFAVHTWLEYHHRARDSYVGEPDMVEWLKKTICAGDIFWDIGANVGAYSILAAKLCKDARVFSFEPFIPTFGHLWENIALNNVSSQVFPLCVGLSDCTRLESLSIVDPRAGSAGHQVGGTGGVLNQGIVAIRGDDLHSRLSIPEPTILKLDIDGLEVSAVEGLFETLRRPTLKAVMIEVTAGNSEEPVQRACEAAGLKRIPNPLTQATGGAFNASFVRHDAPGR